MNLIDRDSLLEKIQFRIKPEGIVGETVRDMVEKTREIILAEPLVQLNFNRTSTEPMTNADKIRNMTDEELAYWVMCPYDSIDCAGTDHNCIECTLEWLKQPAEVE